MKISTGERIKKSDRFYRITLYFNEQPYLDKIAANERLIEDTKKYQTLFDGVEGGDQARCNQS